ncbi:MAG: nucleoside triphosphate pyrophosphohydrolase [Steroidobacteraceae bacterium]
MSRLAAIDRLREVMIALRDPVRGCPWDRVQTFASIVPHTIEEAYELEAAICGAQSSDIRDELGDLLFQVVFLARIAEERGQFDFDDVANAIADKLVRRHPHVFAPQDHAADEIAPADWDAIKAQERSAKGHTSTLDDIPQALPALARAAKLGRRAARVGFDWPDAKAVRCKVAEELDEADAALAHGEGRERFAEEFGDLLFSLVNWARHVGIDPEVALRAANHKFATRFRAMEEAAALDQVPFAGAGSDEWERRWQHAKSRF